MGVKQLADQLQVSKPTIQRDLATLQNIFAVIEESAGKQKKTYRIDGKLRALEAITFGAGELLATYAAVAGMKSLDKAPFYEDLQTVMLKIRGFLGPSQNGWLDELQRVFRPHPRGFVDYGPHREQIDDLTDAIARRRVCTMTYHSPRRGTTRTHQIRPLQLLWHGSSLYLLACVGTREEITTFAVHRIRELEQTSATFPPPRGIDLEAFTSRAFGIFVSDLEEEVEILFDNEIAWRIEEQTFHPHEKKRRLEDGTLVYQVRSSAQWEIIPWVRSFGPLAELIAPREWRDVLHANLEAAAARYRPEQEPAAPKPPGD